MKSLQNVIGMEINPKFVGALFTEQIGGTLRVFCFYTNGDISQLDMPAEENLGNLKRLYTKLNIDENCSSLIVDDVVQGRVYVRAEGNCWLYTLLSAPGNILPTFNADICDLPWRHCWRSKAVDVLEYGEPGKSGHCFAIRTQISGNDASRLVQGSNAFTNPSSVQRKQPRRWSYLGIGVVVAVLGILLSLTLLHADKPGANGSLQPPVTMKATAEINATGFDLLFNHEISGPYPGKTIASLNEAGLLKADTMCRPENSVEWISLATLFPTHGQR